MTAIDLGRPISVPEEKRAKFKALSETPEYSWPTIILSLVVLVLVVLIDIWALSGGISLVAACALLVFVYYWFFSIIHDGVHRTISKNKAVNDFIGQAAISLFAPYASMGVFRWAHMEHHRFTNDEGDPDSWSHGVWWSLPFRWMTIDLYYAYRAIRSDKPAVKKVLNESLIYIVIGMAIIVGLIAAGYGLEYIMLWFLPTRLAFIFIGFAFFWLPHAHWPNDKVDLRQSKNFTIATTLRVDKEWILNPLLQYQNFHLVHHLWPTAPFYNNEKLFILLEHELHERDLAIAYGFTIQPELKPANP